MSASLGPIFHDDENWRNAITEIVAPNRVVSALDNSVGSIEKELLRDDAMQVTEPESETIELVIIPKAEAKERILSYINSHVGCRTGDIIYDLGLDPDLVIACLRELESAKQVRGKDVDRN